MPSCCDYCVFLDANKVSQVKAPVQAVVANLKHKRAEVVKLENDLSQKAAEVKSDTHPRNAW